MNKLKFLPFLFSSLLINTQELDKEFLDSLPGDIREDVLVRSTDQTKETESNYRPSRFSSKLEQEEDLQDLKERIERDLIELEKRLDSDNIENKTEELELFGSNFFSTFQTSFMPINEPNPDSSYVLDTGDILKIQLIGQEDYIDTFVIGKDGSINLPEIGKIVIAGKDLGKASALIESRVSSSIIGTEVFISLDSLRDVNILVSGNAKNPGIYTLTGNSNILHALTMAGGINEYGSYREINLLRNNIIVESLDVYDLLITGNYSLQKRLRSGDVVFVEIRKKIVTIDGAVKRAAKYEIAEDENLDKVVEYSGGHKQTADLQNTYLERILDGTLKSIPILNESQFSSIEPYDGDLIYFREYPYRKAKVSGAVLKPGSYTMAAGETIEDLIDKAGGLTDNSYPFGAVYENKDAERTNIYAKEVIYRNFLDNIIAVSQQNIGQQSDLTPLISLMREVKRNQTNGRVIIDLLDDNIMNARKIQDGDSLIIPEKTNNIYVFGETSSQGAVGYEPNEDLEYFVDKSGGYKNSADFDSIYILQPNGETIRYSKKRNLFESKPRNSIKIYPGSIIFVPKKIDNATARRMAAQAYVSILGSLGVTLASLSSINNN